MREPLWVKKETVFLLHESQLAEHGGGSGVRDEGLLDSALGKPQNLFAYGGGAVDLAALAASYAYGIARNYPFVDGNKRTALVVSFLFLRKNGYRVASPELENYKTFLALAAGEVSEEDLAAWFRGNIKEG
jgi:death-on-curing protein